MLATASPLRPAPSFLEGLPLASHALTLALERHREQVRDGDRAPFVLHPLEVALSLHLLGYRDAVVAAAVLHDILEDTPTAPEDIEELFGSEVAELVQAVSEDAEIDDDLERKAALRDQVAHKSREAAAIFVADKVSKARELRLRLSCELGVGEAVPKFRHYRATMAILEPRLGRRDPLIEQLRFELEMLEALPPERTIAAY
jgi:hypothetical protein